MNYKKSITSCLSFVSLVCVCVAVKAMTATEAYTACLSVKDSAKQERCLVLAEKLLEKESEIKKSKWHHHRLTDEMTDVTKSVLFTQSIESTASGIYDNSTLSLMCGGGELNVIVRAGGRVLDDEYITYRFDSDQPINYKWLMTRDMKALLFPGDSSVLIEKMISSSTLLMRLNEFPGDTITARFDLLDMPNKLKLMLNECAN